MRHLALAVAALGLVACGSGGVKIGGGKEGAAQAMYAATQPTQDSKASTGGFNLFGSVSAACSRGGEVKLKDFNFNISVGTGSAGTDIGYTAEYVNCKNATSEAGDAVLNGTLSVANLTSASSSGAVVRQSFKGKLQVGGAFNDFLDADIVQEVSAGTSNGPMVSVLLKGTIANSGGSYSYNESVNVESGKISIDISAK